MLLEIILLILAFPIGYLISWMARDELIAGRKWFLLLILVSVFGVLGSLFFYSHYIGWTLGFSGILGLVAYYKSQDRKWTRKRINERLR